MKSSILFILISMSLLVIIGALLASSIALLFLFLFKLIVLGGNANGDVGLIILLPILVGVAIGGVASIAVSYFICMRIAEKLIATRFFVNHPRKLFAISVMLSPITLIAADFVYVLIRTTFLIIQS